MKSELNLAVIYHCRSPQEDLRRAILEANFEECGYMVSFHPVQARASVDYQTRHMIPGYESVELRAICDLYMRCVGGKDPLTKFRKDGGWKGHGISELFSNRGSFSFACVYQAEMFASLLAEYLRDWHAEKWKWVCIQETKIPGSES